MRRRRGLAIGPEGVSSWWNTGDDEGGDHLGSRVQLMARESRLRDSRKRRSIAQYTMRSSGQLPALVERREEEMGWTKKYSLLDGKTGLPIGWEGTRNLKELRLRVAAMDSFELEETAVEVFGTRDVGMRHKPMSVSKPRSFQSWLNIPDPSERQLLRKQHQEAKRRLIERRRHEFNKAVEHELTRRQQRRADEDLLHRDPELFALKPGTWLNRALRAAVRRWKQRHEAFGVDSFADDFMTGKVDKTELIRHHSQNELEPVHTTPTKSPIRKSSDKPIPSGAATTKKPSISSGAATTKKSSISSGAATTKKSSSSSSSKPATTKKPSISSGAATTKKSSSSSSSKPATTKKPATSKTSSPTKKSSDLSLKQSPRASLPPPPVVKSESKDSSSVPPVSPRRQDSEDDVYKGAGWQDMLFSKRKDEEVEEDGLSSSSDGSSRRRRRRKKQLRKVPSADRRALERMQQSEDSKQNPLLSKALGMLESIDANESFALPKEASSYNESSSKFMLDDSIADHVEEEEDDDDGDNSDSN